jgi:hypothetical protein
VLEDLTEHLAVHEAFAHFSDWSGHCGMKTIAEAYFQFTAWHMNRYF